MSKPQKSPSKASLKKAHDWAWGNEKDPLAEAYINACCAITYMEESYTIGKWAQSRKIGEGTLEYYSMWNAGISYRDAIARVILNQIKRERKFSNERAGTRMAACG